MGDIFIGFQQVAAVFFFTTSIPFLLGLYSTSKHKYVREKVYYLPMPYQ
jgi:hypothetical protein